MGCPMQQNPFSSETELEGRERPARDEAVSEGRAESTVNGRATSRATFSGMIA